jgi:hypothetical protein
MLLLTATTDKLQLVTSAAATVDVHASYMDHTLSSDNVEGGRQLTAITTATTTDIVAAPASGVVRNVKALLVRNKHASTSCDVTVVYDANGTDYELHKVTLAAGEGLEYVEGVGYFHLRNTARLEKTLVTSADVVRTDTAWGDVTDLTTPILAGKTYAFFVWLIYLTNATTTGARFGVNGPALTYLRLNGVGPLLGSPTASATFTTGHAAINAVDTSAIGAQTTGSAVENAAGFGGTIVPSADGTFAVRAQSEVAVAAALTIRRGSWCQISERSS